MPRTISTLLLSLIFVPVICQASSSAAQPVGEADQKSVSSSLFSDPRIASNAKALIPCVRQTLERNDLHEKNLLRYINFYVWQLKQRPAPGQNQSIGMHPLTEIIAAYAAEPGLTVQQAEELALCSGLAPIITNPDDSNDDEDYSVDPKYQPRCDSRGWMIKALSGIPRDYRYFVIDVSDNLLSSLGVQDLGPSKGKDLRGIHFILSHNTVSFIADGALAQVALGFNAERGELDLSHNRLTQITQGMLRTKGNKLGRISLAHNQITAVARGSFSQHTDLEELDLSHNQLQTVPNDLAFCRNLKTVNLDGNPLLDDPQEKEKYLYLKKRLEAAQTPLLEKLKSFFVGRTAQEGKAR